MQGYNPLILVSFPLASFILGSIPWGIIITRFYGSVDVREHGSGNIGATNVRRVAGLSAGLLTLLGDLLKGIIPVFAAGFPFATNTIWHESFMSICAMFAFFGHLFPVFTGFKNGGKGVATAAGCFLILNPWSLIISVPVFLLITRMTNYVSAGSIAAAGVLPCLVFLFTRSVPLTLCAFSMFGFIVFRHRENIKRMISGTEHVFKQDSSPD